MPQDRVVTHLAIVQISGLIAPDATLCQSFDGELEACEWVKSYIERIGGTDAVVSHRKHIDADDRYVEGESVLILTGKETPVWGMVVSRSIGQV